NGDGNAQITLADLTPIGVNFGRRVEKYNVYASSATSDLPQAPGAASTVAPIGSVAFAQHAGVATQQRLQFSFALSAPDSSLQYWVRPADGASEGTPSNEVRPSVVNSNAAPVIDSLVSTPPSVASEGSASIVATVSDPNGDAL